MTTSARLILASSSPRRHQLLEQIGVEFRAVPSSYEEHGPGDDPGRRVLANALGKAREVAAREGVPAGGAVLGADTEVAVDGRTLGKPADMAAARDMLRTLSGRAHQVLTAVVLITAAGERTQTDMAEVRFRELGDRQIEWYLNGGEWRGKAGGYAIQGRGAALVAGISGDQSTVVGLPLGVVAAMLTGTGLAPWDAPSAGS